VEKQGSRTNGKSSKMAMCSMWPTLTLSAIQRPGYGWQSVCGELNCSHYS